MKNAIYSAMAFLAVIIQTTVMPRVQFLGVKPDLLCALLTCVAAVAGPVAGAVIGAVSGLALDYMFMAPGFYALQYLLLGFLVGALAQRFTFDRFLLPGLACFASFTIKELVVVVYLFLQRAEINFPAAMGKLLLGGLYTVFLAVPLFQVILAISKINFGGGDGQIFGQRRL